MKETFVALCCLVFFIACVAGSGGLIGGRRDVNLNENEQATNALSYVVRQHNINMNSSNSMNNTHLRAVSDVLNAQSQVVAGMKYYFTVIMALTNCTMGSVNEVCTIPEDSENAQTYRCEFTVWSRPWIDSTIVTEKCDN